MADNFVWMVRIIQIILIIGILAIVWFGRGDMDVFDSPATVPEGQ